MYERDLGFEIFGQKFTLGTERLVFDTVVPTIDETRPDGSFRVVFKPAPKNFGVEAPRALDVVIWR